MDFIVKGECMRRTDIKETAHIVFVLLKAAVQIVRGMMYITMLPKPRVTIFGGHMTNLENRYAKEAEKLGYALIKENISVITGGGRGIMEAANCGAWHGVTSEIQARSIGITVKGLETEKTDHKHSCISHQIVIDQFFARKWLLINYADAFAVFPGGFGTIDEFGEIVTLMQTKKLTGEPIVLIGRDYWAPFIAWLNDTVLKDSFITREDINLFHIADTVEQAIELLKVHCKDCH